MITVWRAIHKKKHEAIYETDTKNKAKRLRETTIAQ
jgi:hypothetical protein